MGSFFADDVSEARALSRLLFVLEAPRGARLILEQDDLGSMPSLTIQGPRGGTRYRGYLDARRIDEMICMLGAVRARMLAAQPPERLTVYRRLAEKRIVERPAAAQGDPPVGSTKGEGQRHSPGAGFRLADDPPANGAPRGDHAQQGKGHS